MKGVILDFSIQDNTGVISADDQQRYHFSGADWRGQKPPARGDKVDFAINPEGQATDVYMALAATNPMHNFSEQLDKFSDQSQSEENFNMIDWVVKCLKNYANFTGRARRKEFWFFYLATIILNIATQIIDSILSTGTIFYVVGVLAMFIPTLAAGARRLHDVGRSGWWQLLALTVIGIIPLIIWWASETKAENNQWGQPAK